MRLFDDEQYWVKVRDGNETAYRIFTRHYTFRNWRNREGGKSGKKTSPKNAKRIAGPGHTIILLGKDDKALFIWNKQKYRKDDQQGINCVVFRNEGDRLSSEI